MRKTIILFLLFITGLLPLSASIKPEQTLWGFDGRIQINRMNPVSILFSNPSPEVFEGQVMFQKTDGIGARIGAPQVQHLFLGPYAFRWVQFYPYIRDKDEQFVCFWGRGSNNSFFLRTPSKNEAAVVMFTSPNSTISSKRIRIRPFPEHLFPPSVSMTGALKAAVIEETPEFTPVQNEAFFNWLYGGGKLFLLPDSRGIYPRFQGKSSVINSPEQEFKIGQGSVKKLPASLSYISASSIGIPPPKIIKPKKKDDYNDNQYRISNITNELFRKLREDVKTNHNWGLIAFVTVVYLILIVVVNYIIARKTRKVGLPLIFFAITVILFSLLFALIGRRGYGEKSQLTSISFAKAIGNGNFDVAQWMNIFVTDGDYYRITYPATTNFYSTCQTMESVNGRITNGLKGDFYVDIPLYSSRSLYHRGMMAVLNAKVISADFTFSKQGVMEKADIKLGKDFPKIISQAHAVYKGHFYDMAADDVEKTISLSSAPITMKKYAEEWSEHNYYPGYYDNEDRDFSEIAKSMVPSLIFRNKPLADDEKVHLYILTRSPNQFNALGEKIKTEKGFTLYYFQIESKK